MSLLPCQDALGQLSAVCATLLLVATKTLRLAVVLCLPSSVLLGTLPALQRASTWIKVP